MTFIPSVISKKDEKNSFSTSNTTSTGSASLCEGYESVNIVIENSLVNSTIGGLEIQFSPDTSTANFKTYFTDTYFANTILNKSYKVVDKYYRIIFTKDVVDSTTYTIISRLTNGSYVDTNGTDNYYNTKHESTIDAFGRLRASLPYTILDLKFPQQSPTDASSNYLNNNYMCCFKEVGTGSFNVSSGNSQHIVDISGDGTTSTYISQSRHYGIYQPGKSFLVLLTGILNDENATSTDYQNRIGYFDDDNGLYFKYDASEQAISANLRSNMSGSTIDTTIEQSNWNIDKMDGSGNSGYKLYFTKAQIMAIDFEWLSIGKIRFGFFIFGNLYYCHQISNYNYLQEPYMKSANLPIRLVKDEKGREVSVEVRILGRTVSARVWQLNVGRVTLYLLDTDFQLNSEEDRKITNQLYGGDSYTRVSQEILLGIGGVKALRKLGIKPSAWHMNEGHSAFLGLERIREFISERELSFDQALEAVASNTLFTTHTPVPAGNDKFGFDLIEQFFNEYLEGLKISKERFLELGKKDDEFNLTVLSLKLSRYHNGVSKLHGQVSQDLWKELWGEIPPSQNPIDYVTNGIHTKTWLANELAELYTTKLGADWEDKISDLENWKNISKIADSKLWAVKQKQKVRMIEFIKVILQQQYEWEGVRGAKAENPELLLDPNVLTLGFARRFATYKRANLIFKDKERLKEILNHSETPIQIIFAGKAHPADKPGQEIVKEIYQLSREPEFEGKIIILENYNMKIARYLMAGVDIWLNNPRRPLEASGTSGQKAALNGVVNFSVLDGWWYEAWDKTNGWAIGKEIEYDDPDKQDLVDLNSFYDTLQRKILPAYYNKNKSGVSKDWLSFVKNSIATIAPQYSTDRMVKDYFTKFYSKANQSFDRLASDNFLVADYLVNWKNRLFENWEQVKIELVSEKGIDGQLLKVGDSLEIIVKVELGVFAKEEVSVELYVAGIDETEENTQVVKMDLIEEVENSILCKGVFSPKVNGKFGYSARIIPKNDLMVHQYELGLAKWID